VGLQITGAIMKKSTITLFFVAAFFCGSICSATDLETVAVIGTGDMGDSLGPRFAELGYRVVYGSRHPESDKVKALVKKTGSNASATTPIEAARQGESTSEGLVSAYDANNLAKFPARGKAPTPCIAK
jgi:hypothetical protein